MMYRPKDWKYQVAIKCDIDKHPEKTWDVAHSYGWRDGHEAGADAMVEGQKKEGWRVNGDSVIPASGGYPEIHVPGGMKGYLVFIPEES